MATFQFRCSDPLCVNGSRGDNGTGVVGFEVRRPIDAPATRTACPACGTDATRVWTAPMLSLAPRPVVAALDRAEKSRFEPDVVTALPTGRRRRAARPASASTTTGANPALQRLPRP